MRLTCFFGIPALLLTLAACGASSANAPTAAPAASVAPVAPAPTTAAAPTAALAATAVAAPATVAAPAVAPSAATAALDALPSSKTPEGYQSLGDPNAPLTLTMYSDFL